jgi:hypothetical protein
VVTRLLLVPVLALALVLSACSGDEEPAAAATPPAGAGPSVYGPFQDTRQAGYDYLTAQQAINKKRDAAWVACMKGKGYDLPAPTPTKEQILLDGFHIAYGTDIADPNVRAKEGYGVTSRLVGIPSVYSRNTAAGDYAGKLPPTQRAAFDAVLEICSDEAHTKVLPTTDLTALDDAGRQIRNQIDADPRLRTALAEWSGCMKVFGYDVRRMDDPADQIDAKAKPLYKAARPGVVSPAAQALHAEELKMAAQDWTCQKQTITPAFQTVRNELEDKWLEEHAELADRVYVTMDKIITSG